MTVYIKKTDTIEEMNRKIEKVMRAGRKRKKKFDPYKYLGKGIFKGADGLEYQKQVRDEWQR